LGELQAAVLNLKLQHLDKWNSGRLKKAKELQRKIGESAAEYHKGDICHLFVVRVEKREELRSRLAENQIDCQVHYPIPIHKQTLFNSNMQLPVAEKLCNEVLSVPNDFRVMELVDDWR